MRHLGKATIVLVAVVITALVFSTALMAQQRGRRMGSQQGMRGYGGQTTSSVPGLQQYPLSASQRDSISRIRSDARREMQQVRQNPNLTAQQKADRIREIREETHRQVVNVLSDQQKQELADWWSTRQQGMAAGRGAGPGAGMGPMMGMVPGLTQHPLTDAQRQQILDIRTRHQQQMAAVRGDRSLSQQERANRINELRLQQHQQVMNVLTPAQRQEFDAWWSARQPQGARMR